MYYKCHKVDFKCGGLNAASPGWTKKKNATANQKIILIDIFNMQ